jgi:pSer/pThr/pTyr-binding forkhead associated (FHA) protein
MKIWLHSSWPLADDHEIIIDRFPFVIGRRSDNDCSLALAFVSRRHCQFMRKGDQVVVQDLESYNGTFVNGVRALRPLPVRHGDEIDLGPCTFRVSVLASEEETAPSLVSATREDPSVPGCEPASEFPVSKG